MCVYTGDNFYILCRCTLQNCVVCSHARIEERVTLKDTLVGARFTVTKEGESIQVSKINLVIILWNNIIQLIYATRL